MMLKAAFAIILLTRTGPSLPASPGFWFPSKPGCEKARHHLTDYQKSALIGNIPGVIGFKCVPMKDFDAL